jgi:hypothetical protein
MVMETLIIHSRQDVSPICYQKHCMGVTLDYEMGGGYSLDGRKNKVLAIGLEG